MYLFFDDTSMSLEGQLRKTPARWIPTVMSMVLASGGLAAPGTESCIPSQQGSPVQRFSEWETERTASLDRALTPTPWADGHC